MLIDTYGRQATDLRVSLTDRCNLRCTYCMPEEGLQWLGKGDLLTDDEIVRLIDIAVTSLGIEEVRFTGGEPLLRPGLVGIVERVAALPPRPQMSLTTNGIGLKRTASALKAAGLDRVNVSLDTLRPDVFGTLTRRDRHKDVIEGLHAARQAGLTPVKVNSVLMPGLNDDEAPDLLAWAVEHDYELRFIEQMPLDAQHGWKRDGMITAGDILTSLRTRFDLSPEGDEARGSAPAERWLVDGGPHVVGVIASVTRPFCAACDRPGSPPTARYEPVSSPARRPTCARPCARAPRTRRSRGSGARRCGARRRARAWTPRPSSSRIARCQRSEAEQFSPGTKALLGEKIPLLAAAFLGFRRSDLALLLWVLDGVGHSSAAVNTAALLGVVRITGNAALGSPYTLTAMQHQIRGSTTEPSGDAVTATATRVAQQSTVKVTGQVGDTGRGSEGSGSSTATAWR